MLKKKLIPTPLLSAELHRHRGRILSGDAARPIRHRFLYIMRLIVRVIWHKTMVKMRPPEGPKGIYTPLRLAQMVRESMERLGGLWIKAAQIMAMRRDIFPKVFCDELASLHDRAGGFPGDVAVQIIEQELRCRITDVCDEFDVVPIAAASIGQVHVARLRDNSRKVAIKVQRPGAAESFGSDFIIIERCVALLRLIRFMSWSRWDEMLSQLQRTLTDELDYRLEVASMRRMRRTLKRDKIYAPRAFRRYCTKRVLVMEFLEGVLMSDYIQAHVDTPELARQWCIDNKVRPKVVGRKLFLSFTMQLLDDNLLHGDLHPGNIMLLRNNRIALIDFGTVSRLESGFLEKYRIATKHLARREFAKYADVFLTMVPGVPNVDIESLRLEIAREFEAWEALTDVRGIPYAERALAGVNVKLSVVFGKYKLPPMWNLLRIIRSSTAIDASLQFLIPEIDYFKLMRRHFQRSLRRLVKVMASKKSRDAMVSTIAEVSRLPEKVGDNLVFQAELIRKRAVHFQATLSKAARIGVIVVSMLVNVGLIALVVTIGGYLAQQSALGIKTLQALHVDEVLKVLSSLSLRAWFFIVILAAYFVHNLMKLARVLGFKGVAKNPFI